MLPFLGMLAALSFGGPATGGCCDAGECCKECEGCENCENCEGCEECKECCEGCESCGAGTDAAK